ncbi:octanoyl-[acyl-carrier-protein]:protein N-octanoyltransferase LIPT2, mitochondrial-like [Amphiura filiformis]|uniref:octanoyl-[acyl-carrier-protein]:protein N-octanoyltransferase LIPT2, mitochondrial-like n=1 Tax=Amphiura filiformis TaxID=82378 RepID=UPI003B20CFC9
MSIGTRLVSVLNLGRIGYKEAWAAQQIIARRHMPDRVGPDLVLNQDKSREKIETAIKESENSGIKDTLILCEHNPVYTIGIRTTDYPLVEEERLKKLGAEFYRTDRGGLITFHGPGQLVAYPILNLNNYKKSIRWYVCQLETCIIKLCKEYGIKGETSPHTGVWVRDNKIAAIGIHSKRYITSHGLALNCNTDLKWFNHIVPCGIVGKGVTSLTRELNHEVTIADAIHVFVKCFSEQFGCEVQWTNFNEGIFKGTCP